MTFANATSTAKSLRLAGEMSCTLFSIIQLSAGSPLSYGVVLLDVVVFMVNIWVQLKELGKAGRLLAQRFVGLRKLLIAVVLEEAKVCF